MLLGFAQFSSRRSWFNVLLQIDTQIHKKPLHIWNSAKNNDVDGCFFLHPQYTKYKKDLCMAQPHDHTKRVIFYIDIVESK